jgi:hypothetical protein
MFRIGGVSGKIGRHDDTGTLASASDVAARFSDDPAKSLVMMYLSQFVENGFAEWRARDDGDLEIRFVTGEIFLMADATMTRLA